LGKKNGKKEAKRQTRPPATKPQEGSLVWCNGAGSRTVRLCRRSNAKVRDLKTEGEFKKKGTPAPKTRGGPVKRGAREGPLHNSAIGVNKASERGIERTERAAGKSRKGNSKPQDEEGHRGLWENASSQKAPYQTPVKRTETSAQDCEKDRGACPGDEGGKLAQGKGGGQKNWETSCPL